MNLFLGDGLNAGRNSTLGSPGVTLRIESEDGIFVAGDAILHVRYDNNVYGEAFFVVSPSFCNCCLLQMSSRLQESLS